MHGVISCVRYGSPCQVAGMLPGDKVVRVNFEEFSLDKIHGNEGDIIYLDVMRRLEPLEINDAKYPETYVPLSFRLEYVDARKIDYKTPPEKYYEDKQLMEIGPDA